MKTRSLPLVIYPVGCRQWVSEAFDPKELPERLKALDAGLGGKWGILELILQVNPGEDGNARDIANQITDSLLAEQQDRCTWCRFWDTTHNEETLMQLKGWATN